MGENKTMDEKKEIKKDEAKTYVITAAQGIQNPYSAKMYGKNISKGKPNKPLIENIGNYVKSHNAELQICSIPGEYINEIELDPFFYERKDVYIEKNAKQRNEQNKEREKEKREAWSVKEKTTQEFPMHYFWEEIPETDYKITGKRLNSNVRIVGVPEPSQNKDPLVGKQRLTQKHGGNSIILPSPKQNLRPVAVGQAGEYPKLMITTGCCTVPNYNTSNRTGEMAEEAHKYGFAVIDVIDDKIYLPRIVNAQKNGTFVDLGIKYTRGKDPERAETIAMVIGDSHTSEINPKIEKANRDMIKWFKPKYIHYNDVFNALSINLHNLDDTLLQDILHRKGLDSLENEAVITAEYLNENGKIAKEFGGEIVVNYSNHDDMIYRWLTQMKWKGDVVNRKFVYELLSQNIDRGNTLEKMIKYVMPKLSDNIIFLKPGEDRIYEGYQCGAHGHLGKNGAKGSLKSLMEGYGKVIMGHVHQFEINGDSMSVGTSSKIPLDYQLGQPSTSMAANGVVYKGGLMQGIPIIKGHWAKEGFNNVLK